MNLHLRRELINHCRRFTTNILKSNSVSTVKLAYSVCEPTETQHSGKKTPIVVLHGIFGSRRNWNSLSQLISERTNRKVISPDLRNHGESPHTSEISYRLMGEDVNRLLNDFGINKAVLVGHSAGGRVLTYLALTHPELVEKLICIDFAPIRTSDRIRSMLEISRAMSSIRFDEVGSLSEARALVHRKLSVILPSEKIRQHLIENIVQSESGKYRWCLNLPALQDKFEVICGFDGVNDEAKFFGPTLFVRGTRSDCIIDEDHKKIKELFPAVKIESIDAGHWLHQQKPQEFVDIIASFIDDGTILSSSYWGYIIAQIPGGLLSQKFGGKHIVGVGIFSTGILTVLTPIVVEVYDSTGLIILRLLMGIGEGLAPPAIGDLFAERTTISTIVISGMPIGNILANALSGILIRHSSIEWSVVFYFFGPCSVLWFFVWVLLGYSHPDTHPFITDKEKRNLGESMTQHNRISHTEQLWLISLTTGICLNIWNKQMRLSESADMITAGPAES